MIEDPVTGFVFGSNLPKLAALVKPLSVSSARCIAMVFALPYFSVPFPQLVKIAIGLALSFSIFPLVYATLDFSRISDGMLVTIMLKEAFFGTALGMIAGLTFWAVSLAGYMLDYQRGNFSVGSFAPSPDKGSPFSTLFTQIHTYYFFASGAFLILIGYLYESYQLWPVAQVFPDVSIEGAMNLLSMLDDVMQIALVMVGPLVVVLLLIDAIFGMTGRFSPQFNIFSLSITVKNLAIIFLSFIYFPYMWSTSFFDELHFINILDYMRLLFA